MTTKKNKYFGLLLSISALLSSCLGTNHLKEHEMLLYRQKIEAPPAIDENELREHFVQKANRKLFAIFPIHYLVWLYYQGNKRYDRDKFVRKKEQVEDKFNKKIAAVPESNTKKIGNLDFRKQKKVSRINSKIENGNTVMQWGEPVAIFDTAVADLTVQRFKAYLFSKGYLRNNVTYKLDTFKLKVVPRAMRDNIAQTTYFLNPGKAYVIDTILYSISDTTIFRLYKENIQESVVRQHDQYDQERLTQEHERIDLMLKDLGYYDFSRQYIEFDVDTSFSEEHKVALRIVIKDPAKRGYHKRFVIDEVNFTTDRGLNLQGVERKTRNYRNIHYRFYEDNYNLRILSQRVFILPDSLFNRTLTFNTQRQLANLDAFKFVNINYDTSGGKFIANIFTSPLDRYQWSNEAGVNVTQGYPGPFYYIGFKKRNVFKGLETFDLTGRIGLEGVAPATSNEDFYRSTEAGINASMTFPKLLFPFREQAQFKLGRYNPKTKVQAGYAYTNRPEYRRTNVSFSGTYYMENKRTTQYSFTFANIGLIDTLKTSPAFRDFLSDQRELGNFSLINAFSPALVNSSIIGITWNHNDYGSTAKNAVYIRAAIESGGTIWNLLNPEKFISSISDPLLIRDSSGSVIRVPDGSGNMRDSSVLRLQYYKYFRFSLDIRRNRVLNKNTVLAYRFNSGVAYGYGDNKSVPYEKFFFAGGSTGIRAWSPRRLGPGSYRPAKSETPRDDGYFSYSIEKPAEILLEGSVELRKKLFGFVDGAVFADAGNVWTFREWSTDTETNGSSQFKADQFYKQIGVGTGFGLRFDFTFLILRLDVGIKVYDPARDEGDRFVLDDVRFLKPYYKQRADGSIIYKEPVIYNVGIGYPF